MDSNIKESIRNYYEVYFGIGSIYDKLAKKHGITSGVLFVLYVIYENQNNCTQRLICAKLLYPKQTVNTILDSFHKQGYITKRVANSDKRNKYILLTESGKNYAESVLSAMLHLEETAFERMSEEDRQAMMKGERAFLEQLTQFVDELE
ncbi:MarR family winged helix-turn-helix transcriptional regulator [Paenibacillus terrae]|uniref:MarR family transcriptional regulator n=1 Tax=Paenibacillus terrae (strain HPL-003) TaxID=985665 RepID=G7VZK6_PAETH|nr:MarR family winged helix-turn-helix transcriptional regulator [Paenibacillus terrae]AET57248.1 MarR family transcriptional regulator [Paenibacillus terrae HPL-003]